MGDFMKCMYVFVCVCVCVCVCVWHDFEMGEWYPYTDFGLFYPKENLFINLLNLNHSNVFFEAKDTKPEVLLGFENFQVVAHWNLECQFLRIFHFGKFSIYQKKFQVFYCNWILFFKAHFSLSTPHWHMPITKHYHFGKKIADISFLWQPDTFVSTQWYFVWNISLLFKNTEEP